MSSMTAVFQPRYPKLVDEWHTAVARFARLHDDPPVETITASMVRTYRRTCAELPARAGKAIATLPLLKQVELAEAQGLKTLSLGFNPISDLRDCDFSDSPVVWIKGGA